jgi:hypothetical protein
MNHAREQRLAKVGSYSSEQVLAFLQKERLAAAAAEVQ